MMASNQSPLQKTIGYFDNILNSLLQAVLFIDRQGIVKTYNRTAELILGIESKKVINQRFWDLFPDDLFGFSIKAAFLNGIVEKRSLVTIALKEGPQQFELSASFAVAPPSLENEDPNQPSTSGLLLIMTDINEIKRSQKLNMHTDKMKEFGELAAMVAHEIRNPLGGIKGIASLLQRDLVDFPELHKLASYIVEGTDDLNRRVSSILNYTHAMELSFEPLDLVHLMEEIIFHLNADDGIDPRIELRTRSSVTKLVVPVDAASLKSAILNLTSNAIQAMPAGGELLISLDVNEREAIIRVSDTGFGIPKENIEKIFSPFFTTMPKGHGLGLTEVGKIIHAHDGLLEFSSNQGKGTTFTIRLPLQRNHENSLVHCKVSPSL